MGYGKRYGNRYSNSSYRSSSSTSYYGKRYRSSRRSSQYSGNSNNSYSSGSSSYSRGKRYKSYGLQTRKNSSGYKQFKDPGTGKWEYTHRRVAEKKLGGKIYNGYEVHHIDGNKSNNRPSNLTVIRKGLHRWIHRKKHW